MHAYDLQGSLLSDGIVSNVYPAALLADIAIAQQARLFAFATDLHYPILTTNPDNVVGREMVGLAPIPAVQLPPVPYTYGGGDLATEASNWIAAAASVYNHLPRAAITNSLSVNRTLEALLFELKAAQLLGARGINWWTNLTLFPFRPSDAGRVNPSQDTLLALETQTSSQPGYKLQVIWNTISNLVENSAGPDIANLRGVAQDIYRIDSVFNNTNPAGFVSPVDEIRYFLWNGTLDSSYSTRALTSAQFLSASNGATAILAAVSPRPTTNVVLVVRNDTFSGACRILDLLNPSATFTLLDPTGVPFVFPNNFNLLPGSLVQISGYTDPATPNRAYPGIEVTAAGLNGVPIATDDDTDGNLLIDTWEKQFFGALGLANPFADTDGDGYSNLQEMLDGSDPRDFYGRPSVPPVVFGPPVLAIVQAGSQIEIHFQWPTAYISRFRFGVQHANDLSSPFTTLAAPDPVNVSGDEFKITVTLPPTTQQYYFLAISLY